MSNNWINYRVSHLCGSLWSSLRVFFFFKEWCAGSMQRDCELQYLYSMHFIQKHMNNCSCFFKLFISNQNYIRFYMPICCDSIYDLKRLIQWEVLIKLLLGRLALSHLRLLGSLFCHLLRLAGIMVEVFLPTSIRGRHRINAHRTHKHPCFSGIRTHDHSVGAGEDISCLRPRGHCDRHCSC
jgi:hypothetical protein